jgi:hypothetical protein
MQSTFIQIYIGQNAGNGATGANDQILMVCWKKQQVIYQISLVRVLVIKQQNANNQISLV